MKIQPTYRLLKRALLYCLQIVTAVYVALVMFTNMPLFLDSQRADSAVNPIAPYFDMLLLVLAFVMFVLTWQRSYKFLYEPFFKWALLIAVVYSITVVRMLLSGDDIPPIILSEEIDRLQRVVLLFTYGFIVYCVGRRYITNALLLTAALLVPFYYIDFLNPYLFATTDEASSYFRVEATFLNANIAGEALILLAILLFKRTGKVATAVLLTSVGIAAITTFSRGAMGAWVLLMVVVLFSRESPRWYWFMPILLVAFYSTLVAFAETLLTDLFKSQGSVADLVYRLNFWSSVGDTELLDNSGESRADIAGLAWEGILEKPLLGHLTNPWIDLGQPAHNQWLEYWYIFGILGVVICVYTVYSLHRQSNDRLFKVLAPAMLVFGWFSLFNHQLFNYGFWLLFYSMTMINVQSPMSAFGKSEKSSVELSARPKRKRGRRRSTSSLSF